MLRSKTSRSASRNISTAPRPYFLRAKSLPRLLLGAFAALLCVQIQAVQTNPRLDPPVQLPAIQVTSMTISATGGTPEQPHMIEGDSSAAVVHLYTNVGFTSVEWYVNDTLVETHTGNGTGKYDSLSGYDFAGFGSTTGNRVTIKAVAKRRSGRSGSQATRYCYITVWSRPEKALSVSLEYTEWNPGDSCAFTITMTSPNENYQILRATVEVDGTEIASRNYQNEDLEMSRGNPSRSDQFFAKEFIAEGPVPLSLIYSNQFLNCAAEEGFFKQISGKVNSFLKHPATKFVGRVTIWTTAAGIAHKGAQWCWNTTVKADHLKGKAICNKEGRPLSSGEAKDPNGYLITNKIEVGLSSGSHYDTTTTSKDGRFHYGGTYVFHAVPCGHNAKVRVLGGNHHHVHNGVFRNVQYTDSEPLPVDSIRPVTKFGWNFEPPKEEGEYFHKGPTIRGWSLDEQ